MTLSPTAVRCGRSSNKSDVSKSLNMEAKINITTQSDHQTTSIRDLSKVSKGDWLIETFEPLERPSASPTYHSSTAFGGERGGAHRSDAKNGN